MYKFLLPLIVFNGFIVFDSFSQERNIIGTWLTEDKEAHVQLFEKEGKYCGKIVWLLEPLDSNGNPLKDIENSNTRLRKRSIMGLQLIWEFSYDEKNEIYIDGKVYDPDNGKTYTGKIWLEGKDELRMRGYVGWLYSTETWTRVKR